MTSLHKTLHKDVREVCELAGDYGFSFDSIRKSGHIRLRHKSGRMVTISATPGAYSWRKASIAQIKRIHREETR